jgi:hypothetical protein
MTHPGFLALDRYALAPEPGELATHLASCPQCAQHVLAVQQPASRFELGPRRPPRRLGGPRSLALVACAALFVALLLPRLRMGETVTAKGANPAAVLWVNSGGAVRVWQGEHLRAGEAVRFEVAPAGFSHLLVVDVSAAPRILYEAAISGATPTLSPAWSLEASSTRDELAVVLSTSALTEADLPAVLCTQTPRSWCTRFTLEQEP